MSKAKVTFENSLAMALFERYCQFGPDEIVFSGEDALCAMNIEGPAPMAGLIDLMEHDGFSDLMLVVCAGIVGHVEGNAAIQKARRSSTPR